MKHIVNNKTLFTVNCRTSTRSEFRPRQRTQDSSLCHAELTRLQCAKRARTEPLCCGLHCYRARLASLATRVPALAEVCAHSPRQQQQMHARAEALARHCACARNSPAAERTRNGTRARSLAHGLCNRQPPNGAMLSPFTQPPVETTDSR